MSSEYIIQFQSGAVQRVFLPSLWLLLSFIFFGLPHRVQAQEKFEMEQRVGRDKVPETALSFVDSFTKSKVKWYEETGISSKSYEAKFKLNGKRFSVEFDSAGSLEDIEVLMRFRDLETNVKRSISAHLDSVYDRTRIYKLQTQYAGDVLKMMKLRIGISEGLNVKYEIELRANIKGARPELYEYTFDQQGKYLFHKTIILRNADHLEF